MPAGSVVVEVVVSTLKRHGNIDLQQALAQWISRLDKPCIHLCDACFGRIKGRNERRILHEVLPRSLRLVGRLCVPSRFPCKSKCKRRLTPCRARTTMVSKALPHAIGASNIQVRQPLREKIHAPSRHPRRKSCDRDCGHSQQTLKQRRKSFNMYGEAIVHTPSLRQRTRS